VGGEAELCLAYENTVGLGAYTCSTYSSAVEGHLVLSVPTSDSRSSLSIVGAIPSGVRRIEIVRDGKVSFMTVRRNSYLVRVGGLEAIRFVRPDGSQVDVPFP
jgi:hypothetical protein